MSSTFDRLPRWLRVVLAGLAGYALAWLVAEWLVRGFGLSTTYQPLYLGIIAAAVAAGTPAGLLTTVLGAFAQGLSIGPGGQPVLASPLDLMRLVLFLAVGSTISLLAGRVLRERERATNRGDRLARLRENVGEMAAASTPAEIVRVMVDAAARAAGAQSGGIAINDPGKGGLMLLAREPGGPEPTWADAVIPLGADVPVAAAFRDGRSHWLLTRHAAVTAFPGLRAFASVAGTGAVAAIPLEVDGRVFGAAWLTFPDGRPSDPGDRSFVAALVGHAAQALDRARWFEAEHDARLRAEAAEHSAAGSLITLAAVVSVVPDPVFVLDHDDAVVLRNPAADRLFPGDPPRTLVEIASRVRTADDEPATPHELARGEALRVPESGRWVEPQLTPESAAGDLLLVLRDVTQLRDVRAAHDAFLGVLSHELRTPVTTIYGIAQLLDRPAARARLDELAGDVRVEAERLVRLVDDLLVLSRVERDSLEVGEEPVLLQRVIPAVVEAERRRSPLVTFDVRLADDLPPVLGDATYVEQIVRNLVANAAKYGPADGTVTVTGRQEAEGVEIRVTDQGPGLQPDEAERLFELFYRSPSTASTATGAGIGLFVTRQLVTTMGGQIWARPADGGGAEFGFRLQVLDGTADRELPERPLGARA